MSEFRMLTTPEEVLAALRAGEVVESRMDDSPWTGTSLVADTELASVAGCFAAGIHYRTPARPRTFTAAEVAEAFAGLEAKWRAEAAKLDDEGQSDCARGFHALGQDQITRAVHITECADELHERITHWLRENEG